LNNLGIKVTIGFLIAIVVGLVVITLRGGFDPWHKLGMGPGWECEYYGKGAYSCSKDLPPAWEKPRKR